MSQQLHTVTASAPGKVLLLGDHVVVYDRPCLVAAVDIPLTVSVTRTNFTGIEIEAPDLGLQSYVKSYDQLTAGHVPTQAEYIEYVVEQFRTHHTVDSGMHIVTQSQIDSRFGFGTSAATLAATVTALNELFQAGYSKKRLFTIAFQALYALKGVGSGADIASSLYGGVQYFVTGGREIEEVFVEGLCLLAVYSGNKADTPTIVRRVADAVQSDPEMGERLFDRSTDLVSQGRAALQKNNMAEFGRLMEENQQLLVELGVSTPAIDHICQIAHKNGAYGAKLSGAGGGDCVIVAVEKTEADRLIEAYATDGFEALKLSIASQGARIVKAS